MYKVQNKMTDSLDRQLQMKSNQLLPRRITFIPARSPASCFSPPSNKYQPINKVVIEDVGRNEKKKKDTDPSKVPTVAATKVPITWQGTRMVGAGLKNMGNTCFLNATLQCLAYTPPLVNLMDLKNHKPNCRACGFCIYCTLENHINTVLVKNKNQPFAPTHFVKNMRAISPSFRYGSQEDAHEFLRFVISGLQAKEIPKKMNQKQVEPSNSDIFSIFGGYLRSEVHCFQCNNSSFMYDQFLDLSLEISNLNTLEKCLNHFTAAEILEKRDAYSCQHCKALTKASKRFTIQCPPVVLVIQLKRFALKASYVNFRWEKTKKKVQYPSILDLSPYLSNVTKNTNHVPCNYQLYAVLVHDGNAMNSGHYYSIVKASNNTWYKMNDDSVTQTSIQEALYQEAYLLFYVRQSELPELPQNQLPKKSVNPTVSSSTISTSTRVDVLDATSIPEVAAVLPDSAVSTVPFVPVVASSSDTIVQNLRRKKRKIDNLDDVLKHSEHSKKIKISLKGNSLKNDKIETKIINSIEGQTVNVHQNGVKESGFTTNGYHKINFEKCSLELNNLETPAVYNETNGNSEISGKSTLHYSEIRGTSTEENSANSTGNNHSTTLAETVLKEHLSNQKPISSNETENYNKESNGRIVSEPHETYNQNLCDQNGSATKIVGTELVKNLEVKQSFLQVEDFIPWQTVNYTEQEEIQHQKQQQLNQIAALKAVLPAKRSRSDWDKELDKGRKKKVKKKECQEGPNVNRFQLLVNEKDSKEKRSC